MEHCPQSWKLGQTFLDKTASHQVHLLSNLSMVFPIERETNHWNAEDERAYQAGLLMVAPEVQGIDLFKIAGRSISGWVPSYKTGTVIRQPFCSQLEERFMLWLEYHPLVASYARGDIGPEFATKVSTADSTTRPVRDWLHI